MKRSALVLTARSLPFSTGRTRIAFAHHSFTAAYESGKRVEIEGRRQGIHLAQPAFVRAYRGDGEMDGSGDVEPRMGLQHAAVRGEVSDHADDVEVRRSHHRGGRAGRDPEAHRIRIFSIKRPVDGWEWQGVVE
jgi:hypothetical protein